MKIQIFQIKVNDGRREICPEAVHELANSISESGLINPITVDQNYTLIAGLHRLEAAKLLGWTEIECTVSDLEGLMAELAEIDENLIRRGLDYIDEGKQLARRKEIYEALHPETQQGKRNGQTSKTETVSVLETKPFAEDTAEKLGTTARTVRNKIQVAKKLTPDTTKIVKSNRVGFKNALKLSRLSPKQQEEAAGQLVAGAIHSVDEYHPTPSLAEPKSAERKPPKEELSPKTPAPLPEVSAAPVPETGYYPTIRDSVADLKNPDKDRRLTPDVFLITFTLFLQRFGQSVKSYAVNESAAVFPALTRDHLTQIQQEISSVHRALDELFKIMEKESKK